MKGRRLAQDDAPSLRALTVPVYIPTLFFGLGQGAVIPIVALAAIETGASVALAGVIVALRGVGTLIFDVPAGAMVGRLGDKRAMVLATLGLTASLLGCAWSTTPIMFAGFTLLMGCAWAVWLIARLAYVSAVMPVHRRGRALAMLGGMNRVGAFVGPFAGAACVGFLGLAGAFYVHLVTALIGCTVLILAPDPDAADAPERHGPVRVLALAREHGRTFATAGTTTVTIGILRTSRQVVLPLWADQLGYDAATVGIVFGVSSAMDMLLFYPAGMASDRWGRKAVAIPSLVLLALGHVIVPATSSLTGLIVVALVLGFGNGLGSGIVMTLGADFAPSVGRAEFLGAFRLMGDAGNAGGPVIVAVVAGATSLAVATVVIGVVGVVGAAAVYRFMPETMIRRTAAVGHR